MKVAEGSTARDQEGGLEAMPEGWALAPLHLGREVGRTCRRDLQGELEHKLGK